MPGPPCLRCAGRTSECTCALRRLRRARKLLEDGSEQLITLAVQVTLRETNLKTWVPCLEGITTFQDLTDGFLAAHPNAVIPRVHGELLLGNGKSGQFCSNDIVSESIPHRGKIFFMDLREADQLRDHHQKPRSKDDILHASVVNIPQPSESEIRECKNSDNNSIALPKSGNVTDDLCKDEIAHIHHKPHQPHSSHGSRNLTRACPSTRQRMAFRTVAITDFQDDIPLESARLEETTRPIFANYKTTLESARKVLANSTRTLQPFDEPCLPEIFKKPSKHSSIKGRRTNLLALTRAAESRTRWDHIFGGSNFHLVATTDLPILHYLSQDAGTDSLDNSSSS